MSNMEDEDFITQEVVIDAVLMPDEMGTDVIRKAATNLEKMSPEAKELYLEELRRKADERRAEA